MNKSDLFNKVAELTGLTKKDATAASEATLEVIAQALVSGEKVGLQGFGTFETRERAARKGRNPQSGEEIQIPAHNVPVWKAAKALKESIK